MPKEDPFVNRAELLRAIKKYPEIWDSNNKLHMCRSITAPMWNEIADQFGGTVATVKLQSIWSQMKYHYHNLVHRQLLHKDRFTTKWEHFEPMSFMYNITVSKIIGTTATATAAQQQQQTQQAALSSIAQVAPGRGRPSSGGGGGAGGHAQWLTSGGNHLSPPTTTTNFTIFSGLIPPPATQTIDVQTAAATMAAATASGRKSSTTRSSAASSSMRSKIIEAIEKRPLLWTGRREQQRQSQNRTSAVWKEVAAELGLSTSLIQTRWSIIKQRYVDELQKERFAHYNQRPFYSTWEHFERMSFMREILAKKVDDREQTRERIQEIVTIQQQHEQQQLQQHNQHQTQHVVVDMKPDISFTTTGSTAAATVATDVICVDDDDAADEGGGGGSHRRPKTETDLEWDPFEMILQVNGGGAESVN